MIFLFATKEVRTLQSVKSFDIFFCLIYTHMILFIQNIEFFYYFKTDTETERMIFELYMQSAP